MFINRRQFTKTATLGGIGLCFPKSTSAAGSKAPRVAITMDDFNWGSNSVRLNGPERNRAILAALRSHSVKAALFVKGLNVDNDQGRSLLQAWNNEGHLIGNHTYSHWEYNNSRISAEAFQLDILRCERLLKDFSGFQKIFRFPYLKEGESSSKRDAIRQFLFQHGYRTGRVSIDTSDWIVDDRLRTRLAKVPDADLSPYRKFYLDHMWERSLYYNGLAHKVLGRSVKHTILMHFNLLNALFIGDLIDMFKRKGWQVIDASEAFTDPVFAKQPKIVPAGESILWALAKETGRFDRLLRYPGEDGDYELAKMNRRGL